MVERGFGLGAPAVSDSPSRIQRRRTRGGKLPPNLDFLVATGTRRPSESVNDAARFFADKYGGPKVLLIVGRASGFDEAMRLQWYTNGWSVWDHQAPWSVFRQAWGDEKSKHAGPANNAGMAGAAKKLRTRGFRGMGVAAPDEDSQGTWDCVRELEYAGLTVEVRNV